MLMSAGMTSIAFFTLETFWIPFAKPMIESQYAVSIIGVITSIFFFSIAIGVSFSTRLVKLFKGRNINALIFIIVLSGVCFIGLAFTTNIYFFIIMLFALNAAKGARGAPLDSIFHAYVPNDKRSTLLSLQSLIMQVGGMVGMLGLGYVAEQYGIAAAWKIGGSILVISGLILLVLPKRMASTPVVKLDNED